MAYFVQMLYNEDPQFNGFATEELCLQGTIHPCEYFCLPAGGRTVDWRARPAGRMTFADFEHGVLAERQSFASELAWQKAAANVQLMKAMAACASVSALQTRPLDRSLLLRPFHEQARVAHAVAFFLILSNR